MLGSGAQCGELEKRKYLFLAFDNRHLTAGPINAAANHTLTNNIYAASATTYTATPTTTSTTANAAAIR